jgi:hypothetical protein
MFEPVRGGRLRTVDGVSEPAGADQRVDLDQARLCAPIGEPGPDCIRHAAFLQKTHGVPTKKSGGPKAAAHTP